MAGLIQAFRLVTEKFILGGTPHDRGPIASSDTPVAEELLVNAALIASLSNVAYGKTVAEVRARLPPGIDLECVNFQTVTNKLSPQWAVLSGAGCVYVLFRGRKSGIDTLVSSLLSTAELIVPAVGTLHVHAGVLRHLLPFFNALLYDLTGALQQGAERVVVAGHSLGGAYAQIFALLLLRNRPELTTVLEVFAFGSPLIIATPPGRLRPHPLFDRFHLFVNNADVVPRLLGADATSAFLARLLTGRRALSHTAAPAIDYTSAVVAESSQPPSIKRENVAGVTPAAAAAASVAAAAAAAAGAGASMPSAAATVASHTLPGMIASLLKAAHQFHAFGHIYMIRHLPRRTGESVAAHSAAPDAPRDGVGSASGSAEVDVDADADLDAARRLLRVYRVRVCEVSDTQLQHELSAAGGLQAARIRDSATAPLEDHRLYSYIAALQVAIEQRTRH